MIPAGIAVLVVALAIALIVAVARDPGPSPTDVALGYEQAWDRLDFDAVYRVSGSELRDGLTRSEFVAAKKAVHASRGSGLGHLVADVRPEAETCRGDAAAVITRLALADGSVIRNEIGLVRRSGEWVVVSYRLRPAAAS